MSDGAVINVSIFDLGDAGEGGDSLGLSGQDGQRVEIR